MAIRHRRNWWGAVLAVTVAGLQAACAPPPPPAAAPGPMADSLHQTFPGWREDFTFEFFVPPDAFASQVPAGTRMNSLRRMAEGGDTLKAAYLALHPEYADHVLGYVLISRADSVVVDGRAIRSPGSIVHAAWGVFLDSVAPLDERARGFSYAAEVEWWVGDAFLLRRLASTGWPVGPAEIEAEELPRGGIRTRLRALDLEIRAECRELVEFDRWGADAYELTAWAAAEPPPALVVARVSDGVASHCEARLAASGTHPLVAILERRLRDAPWSYGTDTFVFAWWEREQTVYRRFRW